MKKLFFFSILIIGIQCITAQKIQTIYYDENWKVVNTKDESKFYRTLDTNNSDIYRSITDYYTSNGIMYSKVKSALVIDKKDDRKSKFVGKRTFYSTKEEIVKADIYNVEGNLVESYTFNKRNEIETKSTFDSNQFMVNTIFYKDGQIQKDRSFTNGTKDFIETIYYDNGSKFKQIIYTDTIPKYDWYTKWNEKGISHKFYIALKPAKAGQL